MGEENPLLVEACREIVGWIGTIGVPEGGAVYLHTIDAPPGAYTISPADITRLPEGTKALK
jgi:hypothetical protein